LGKAIQGILKDFLMGIVDGQWLGFWEFLEVIWVVIVRIVVVVSGMLVGC